MISPYYSTLETDSAIAITVTVTAYKRL